MSELEKLKDAADLIREVSDGKLRMTPDLYVLPSDDATIGMNMALETDLESQRYHVTFQARTRRMGDEMDSSALLELHEEVWRAYVLLKALETQEFHPTQEDMMALREHLSQEQEQGQQPTGPVMG